jgi:hypothetical protein
MNEEKKSIALLAQKFHEEHHGNCAQSVFYGYKKASGVSEEEIKNTISSFLPFGGGRAPEGCCGALYAAKMLEPSHAEAITEIFRKETQNFTTCKDIRSRKIIPCNRCVTLAGEALDFIKNFKP